mgnify:FL=1
MAYCVASDIHAVCPHLFLPASAIDTSTCPTLVQVNAWITTGCLIVDSKLATLGYAPIGSATAAYGIAQDANINYAAYRSELSRLSARVSRDENTRDAKFFQAFKDALTMLGELGDLTTMGVSLTTRAKPYAGGISVTNKEIDEDDTDVVHGRFQREQLANRESLTPTGTTSAS